MDVGTRAERLRALESSARAAPHDGRSLGGRAYIEQWLRCCLWGEPGTWRTKAEGPPRDSYVQSVALLKYELSRLQALSVAFGLGADLVSIQKGEFLGVNPFRSHFDEVTPSPFAGWCAEWVWAVRPNMLGWRWDMGLHGVTGSGPEALKELFWKGGGDGVEHIWSSFLRKAMAVHRCLFHGEVAETSAFYMIDLACHKAVDRELVKALEPCLEFLSRCVDPYQVGYSLAALESDFGYPSKLPDELADWDY